MCKVSRETLLNISSYHNLLLDWNNKFNLISRNATHLISNYIEDSVSLMRYIFDKKSSLVDLGSGNGMPGLILSIYGVKDVTLIEASSKKIHFLSEAKKISPNSVTLINEFITHKSQIICDILVSRAYGNLHKTLKDTQNFLVKDKYLLIKGQNIMQEVDLAQKYWNFTYKIHNIKNRNFTKILELKKIN